MRCEVTAYWFSASAPLLFIFFSYVCDIIRLSIYNLYENSFRNPFRGQQYQNAAPTPKTTRAIQLPAVFATAAPSDGLVDFSFPMNDLVGPAVADEVPLVVILASTSVGCAAFDPGSVHVGATVVWPSSYAFAVAQLFTLSCLAATESGSSSEQFT
jgi:hypothetical protein